MAEGRVTQTGMREAHATVERLPQAMRMAFRAVAMRSAHRIGQNAARILTEKTHGTGDTAAAIRVREDAPSEQQFLVESKAPQGKPANLPIWLEYSTVKMSARSYMRPAREDEVPLYASGMQEAVERTAKAVGL